MLHAVIKSTVSKLWHTQNINLCDYILHNTASDLGEEFHIYRLMLLNVTECCEIIIGLEYC